MSERAGKITRHMAYDIECAWRGRDDGVPCHETQVLKPASAPEVREEARREGWHCVTREGWVCPAHSPRGDYALVDRFMSFVDKADNGCWLWTGATVGPRPGYMYGAFQVRRGPYAGRAAHRFSYRYFHGPIPEGMCICHRCDEPLCVNPDHLFLGTYADNYDDARRKGRNTRGELVATAKITEDDVREIRRRYAAGGVSQTALANEYGISQQGVGQIVRWVTWTHVE
jgi:hypothetical protein